jgi:hypothetical protein
MIEIDVLLGFHTMKAKWRIGMIKGYEKEFPFIQLNKKSVDIKIAFTDRESIQHLKDLLNEMEKHLDETS